MFCPAPIRIPSTPYRLSPFPARLITVTATRASPDDTSASRYTSSHASLTPTSSRMSAFTCTQSVPLIPQPAVSTTGGNERLPPLIPRVAAGVSISSAVPPDSASVRAEVTVAPAPFTLICGSCDNPESKIACRAPRKASASDFFCPRCRNKTLEKNERSEARYEFCPLDVEVITTRFFPAIVLGLPVVTSRNVPLCGASSITLRLSAPEVASRFDSHSPRSPVVTSSPLSSTMRSALPPPTSTR